MCFFSLNSTFLLWGTSPPEILQCGPLMDLKSFPSPSNLRGGGVGVVCTFLQHSVRSQSRYSSEPFSIMFSSGMLVVVGPCSFHSSSKGGRLGTFSPCHMETISPQEERMQEDYSVREFLVLFSVLFPDFLGHC